MLMRNAIIESKNANCVDFTGCNAIIPLFHKRKHNEEAESKTPAEQGDSPEMNFMLRNLDQEQHSEFVSNVLCYIAGYIITQIIKKISCPACKAVLYPHHLIQAHQVNTTAHLPGTMKQEKHLPLPILSIRVA